MHWEGCQLEGYKVEEGLSETGAGVIKRVILELKELNYRYSVKKKKKGYRGKKLR